MSIKKNFIILVLAFFLGGTLSAGGVRVYSGWWHHSDGSSGPLTATVMQLGGRNWLAKFEGMESVRKFNYNVDMTAVKRRKKIRVSGNAFIGGQNYRWSGYLNDKVFVGRYRCENGDGDFRLRFIQPKNK